MKFNDKLNWHRQFLNPISKLIIMFHMVFSKANKKLDKLPSTSKLLLKAIKMNDKKHYKHCNCRKTFTSNQIIICVPGLANNQTSFQRVLLFKLDQILCKNEPIGIGYFSIGGEEEERRRILSIFHVRS